MDKGREWEVVFTPLGPLQGVIYEQTGNRIKKPEFLALAWLIPGILAGTNAAPIGAMIFFAAAGWEALFGARDESAFDEADELIAAAEARLSAGGDVPAELPSADKTVEVPPDEEELFKAFMQQRYGPDWQSQQSEPVPDPQPYVYQPGINTQLNALPVTATPKAGYTKPRQESATKEDIDPAQLLPSFDQDGNLRSWFICGLPGAGKGTLFSLSIDNAPDWEFWLIDPKDDPNERFYWEAIPSERRLHLDCNDPELDIESMQNSIKSLVSDFHKSPAKPKILIVDELPAIAVKSGKEFAEFLRGYLSNTASMGRSRSAGAWISTQAVGVTENKLTTTSKGSFYQMYLVNASTSQKIINHQSFKLNPTIPPSLIANLKRAYLTDIDNRWKPFPSEYKQRMEAKKMNPIATPLPPDQAAELAARSQQVRYQERSTQPKLYGSQTETQNELADKESNSHIKRSLHEHGKYDTESDLNVSSSTENDFEVDLSGFEISTPIMDLIISGLETKAGGNDKSPYLCLAGFIKQLKERGVGGDTKVSNKKVSDSPWMTEWYGKRLLKSRGKDSFAVAIRNAVRWGVLTEMNATTYQIILK